MNIVFEKMGVEHQNEVIVSSQVKCTLFRHKLHIFLPAVVR